MGGEIRYLVSVDGGDGEDGVGLGGRWGGGGYLSEGERGRNMANSRCSAVLW